MIRNRASINGSSSTHSILIVRFPLFGDDNLCSRAFADRAGDDDVCIAHIFKALFGILHSDVASAVVFSFGCRVKADAVVFDYHFISVVGLAGRYLHRAAVIFHAYAVLDSVFDQRLDRQQRYLKVRRLYVVFDIQLIVKAQLFNI